MPQEQVAYQVSGHGQARLFELYLFVNPLGQDCRRVERELSRAIKQMPAKTDVHILCFTSQPLIARYMMQLGYEPQDLRHRNEIFQKIYSATLAYRAAGLQGKRRGRQYLYEMQSRINSDLERLTDDFLANLACDIGLDLALFESDRRSQYVKELYYRDQKIALEMKVQDTPSLIIFEQCSGDSGILLQGPMECQHILEQVDLLMEKTCYPRPTRLKLVATKK